MLSFTKWEDLIMSNQFSFNGLDYTNPSIYSGYEFRDPIRPNAVFIQGDEVRVTNPVTTLPYPPHTATTLPASFRRREGTVLMDRREGNREFVFVEFPAYAGGFDDNGVAIPAMPPTSLWFSTNDVELYGSAVAPYPVTLLNGEYVLTGAQINQGVPRTGTRRVPYGETVQIRATVPTGNRFVLWGSDNQEIVVTPVTGQAGVYQFTMPDNGAARVIAAFTGTTPGTQTNTPGTGTGTGSEVRIGDRVRVNNNVGTWATGQTMPSWVYGRTYPVIEIRTRNNATELLLGDILSWIRINDVTRVN